MLGRKSRSSFRIHAFSGSGFGIVLSWVPGCGFNRKSGSGSFPVQDPMKIYLELNWYLFYFKQYEYLSKI